MLCEPCQSVVNRVLQPDPNHREGRHLSSMAELMNGVRQRCFICANLKRVMAYHLRMEPTAIIEDLPGHLSTYSVQSSYQNNLPELVIRNPHFPVENGLTIGFQTVDGKIFSLYRFGGLPSTGTIGLALAEVCCFQKRTGRITQRITLMILHPV